MYILVLTIHCCCQTASPGEGSGSNDLQDDDASNAAALEGREPDFPHPELAKLDEMINR